jgi:hypothetical protein
MKQLRIFVMVIAAFAAALPLLAQEQTASLQGVVTDQSGAALPGVTVEAVNAKGQRFSTQTDNAGRYIFPSVPPETYTVTATLAGMDKATVSDVTLSLGSSQKIPLKLGLAAVTETLTVTAEAPLVDVTSSATATSIRSDTFEKLPRGRDFSSVVVQAASANQNNKTGGISIDGASGSENRYIMDGVDTTNPQTGVQGKTLVTEFIEEIQVKSAGYAAEFGGATGGVINVITKTGTNEFKGTVGSFYNDRSWGGSARPVLQINLAGNGFEQFQPREDEETILEPTLTLGGPIVKDRLWFYAGYNPTIQKTTRTITFVPTQGGQTNSYEQEFTRENWVGNVSGSVGTKLLYKATYNSSGYETQNLLPGVTGRANPTTSLYAPDDGFENWTGSGYADFIASPSWFFSAKGGRFYRNYDQSGISTLPRIAWNTGSPGMTNAAGARIFPDITGNLLSAGAGYANIPTNTASQLDAYTRDNLNFDASWFPSFYGTHHIKGGMQIDNLKNEVLRGQQNFLVLADWNGTCGFCNGRGAYGSAAVYLFQTTGNVESKNTGFFLQDSWTAPNGRLSLDVGVRTEQERVPSYADPNVAHTTGTYAIAFDYKDKLAPRLGFAYDLLGTGRTKVYGSYGKFYDITKMEMPRGAFGGDKWIYWGFNIDNPDWTQWDKCTNVSNNPSVKPSCPGMSLNTPGGVDLRHVSNGADNPLIDPDLKPMESVEYNIGIQQELASSMAVGFRYVRKDLARTIEDVGVHVFKPDGSEVEEFFIANPGEGVAQKILEASGCATCPAMPTAKRLYQGFEVEFTKRFLRNWSAHASYVYSKLEGNYSGLANSDEVTATPGTARTSPNVNRIFDSLFMLFDQSGGEVEGFLGGDRPHSFKAQVAYSAPFGTNIGVNQYYYSGTPTTTEMRFQGAPIFPFGRNDMGRTPNITQTDLNLSHDFRLGNFTLQLGGIITNLWDEKEATNIYPIWSTTNLLLRDLSRCTGGDVSATGCGVGARGADETAAAYLARQNAATPIVGGSAAGATRNVAQAASFFTGFDALTQRARQVALGGVTTDFRYGQPNTYQDPREVRIYAKFTF